MVSSEDEKQLIVHVAEVLKKVEQKEKNQHKVFFVCPSGSDRCQVCTCSFMSPASIENDWAPVVLLPVV